MTTTPLPWDIVAPSIPLLCCSSIYTGPKLDKLKANYKTWLKSADLFLTLTGFAGYTKGMVIMPGPNEPCALTHWQANDTLAADLISSTIEPTEWKYIDCNKGAKACWDTLKVCHQSEGPIWQVQLLQEALSTHCSKTTPLPVTAEKICSAIDCAYDMGDISKDLLKCIALLGSLGSDFPHLHSIITRDISAASSSAPFTSVDLCTYLDGEQNLLSSDAKCAPIPDSALSAQAKVVNPIVCTNCKRNRHTTTYCISPGGGTAGKTIEDSKLAHCRDHDLKLGKIVSPPAQPPKGKVSVKVQGTDGHAYFMSIDAEHLTAPPGVPNGAFACIAELTTLPSDPIPDSPIHAQLETLEYSGWMAVEEEL